ncbi:cytochrome c1 [Dongia deserti]|uniref:cytochrome c1 n=1 Tax=Dongia deserti TaxID=2268030 RepID=UPI000E650F9D|nr:cytochrome c1 [Dongia deserti]
MSKGRIVLGLVTILVGAAAVGIVAANPVHHTEIHTRSWSFEGFFGSFDRAQLQRGHVIYKDVCAGCHAMNLLAYRDLQDIGYTEDEVKAFAAEVQVQDGPDDTGEMFERPGRPSDHFKAPFPNEEAARAANNGAYPPDLSLIAKSRAGAGFLGHDGADYIYSLMAGYKEPPADVEVPEGMYYNEAFEGHQIAMPPPLSDGETSVDEQAQDIAAFLTWAAEGNLEERHRTGIKAVLFLVIFTLLAYTVKRRVWANVH